MAGRAVGLEAFRHVTPNPGSPGARLAAFYEGEEETFRELVTTYSPRLLAFASSFAADRQDAHDLVQETWTRVFRKRASYRGRGPLIAWIFSVCRSVCLDRWRRERAAERRSFALSTGDSPADPDELAAGHALRRAIREAVLGLPDRERDVVICRFFDQRSTRETAHLLGMAEGTVKATLHHALRKLRTPMQAWMT